MGVAHQFGFGFARWAGGANPGGTWTTGHGYGVGSPQGSFPLYANLRLGRFKTAMRAPTPVDAQGTATASGQRLQHGEAVKKKKPTRAVAPSNGAQLLLLRGCCESGASASIAASRPATHHAGSAARGAHAGRAHNESTPGDYCCSSPSRASRGEQCCTVAAAQQQQAGPIAACSSMQGPRLGPVSFPRRSEAAYPPRISSVVAAVTPTASVAASRQHQRGRVQDIPCALAPRHRRRREGGASKVPQRERHCKGVIVRAGLLVGRPPDACS
jgi:hypothetical protein